MPASLSGGGVLDDLNGVAVGAARVQKSPGVLGGGGGGVVLRKRPVGFAGLGGGLGGPSVPPPPRWWSCRCSARARRPAPRYLPPVRETPTSASSSQRSR